MASYFNTATFGHQGHHSPLAHHNQGGRNNRRAPRLSMSQNAQRQFRGVRSMKELTDSAAVSTFRTKFEAGRSFDIEDDLEFCPNLLTETDMISISSGSERSSLASNSPRSSPTQQPRSMASSFSLNSASPPFVPPSAVYQQSPFKLHQSAATRGRNAIPIINPATGIIMSSPPASVSPAKLQQSVSRRW